MSHPRLSSRLLWAVVWIVALPVRLIRFVLVDWPKFLRNVGRLQDETLPCPDCGAETPLAALARCPKCHWAEYGSLLRCSRCRTQFDSVTCTGCGASRRVLE